MSTMLNARRPARHGHGARAIADLLMPFLARCRARRAFGRDAVEVGSLSDRTLRDIGVTRGDIPGPLADPMRAEAVREDLFWKL